jgi:hypothetical protein
MKRKLTEDEHRIATNRINIISNKMIKLNRLIGYFELHKKNAEAILMYKFLKQAEDFVVFPNSDKVIRDYKKYLSELNEWMIENKDIRVEMEEDQYQGQISRLEIDSKNYSQALNILQDQVKNGVEVKDESQKPNRKK